MINKAKKITTARGKKVKNWDIKKDEKEIILKHSIGPSGNLRAPTLKIKDSLFIGFNADLYESFIN